MTTPTGTISLSDVNVELGRSSTASINMNESAVRTLAGVGGSGTVISMNNLRGKSNAPTSAYLGGTDTIYLTQTYFFYGGYYEAYRDIVLYSDGTGAYRMGDTNTAIYNVQTFTWLTGGLTAGSYYAYMQVLGGNSFAASSNAINTSLALSTTRTWQWLLSTYDTTVGGYTSARLQIRTASGSVLVQRDIYISASLINGMEP